MNIKNILAFLAIMFLHLSAQAQIIKQVEDSSDGLTTVVIKEENESDIDILNSQFDLEEMGMHQVVRITTGGNAVVDTPTPQVPEQAPNVVPEEVKEEELIFAKVEEPKKVQQKKSVAKQVVKKETKKEITEVKTNDSTSSNNATTVKSSNRRTAFKPYYSKKRFKKKKRKKRSKRSKKRGSCYRF